MSTTRETMRDVDRLRDLLGLSRTREEVDRLNERFEDRIVRAKDIAEVLPESVRAANQTGRLAPALDGAVTSTLRDLVRRDPQLISEALFPVIGPAIRRAIAEAMKSLVQGLNTAMEQKFSARGMRWRLESLRTGVPFREVVLKHTLKYRVSQVFLIDRKSGLLMAHAGDEDALSVDEDAVSAMLVAIQDFIRDSIGDDESEALSSAELDDETLWVITGPRAQLAAVIEGYPPRSLRTYLTERLENKHASYDSWMRDYPDGGDVPPGLSLILDECLQSELKENEKEGGSLTKAILVLALIGALICGALAWWWWKDRQQRQRIDTVAERIEATPGRVLVSIDDEAEPVVIKGLADDLADPPDRLLENLDFGDSPPSFDWSPYRSSELDVVLKRVRRTLEPPDNVGIGAVDGTIVVAGTAPQNWVGRARNFADAYDETWPLDLSRLAVDAPPPPDPVPEPSGPTLAEMLEQINANHVAFARETIPMAGVNETLTTLAELLQAAAAKAKEGNQRLSVTVVGQTDASGSPARNANLRLRRAQWLIDELAARGAIDAGVNVDSQSNSAWGTGDPGRLARVEVHVVE